MMRNNISVNAKRMRGGRLTAFCLAFMLAFTALMCLNADTARAARYSDTESHWASDAIDRWSGYGVLQGVSATQFQPDRAVTRAEFLAMINRAFGAAAAAGISNFTDVSQGSWYYNEIARAVKMGTTNGTSATTMSPNLVITRQEAIVILARALGVHAEGYTALQTFNDANLVAPYARASVSAFVDLGYINGYDGYINPTGTLSRAEAVTVLDNIISDVVSESKALSSPRSVLIKTPGVTLSGSVAGDLIVADGVGTGDISLQSLTVSGRLVIRGGGANSVKMTGVTVRGGTFVQNPNGTTRLVLSGSSPGNVTARTDVIIDGAGASSVTVPAGLSGRVGVTLSGAAMDAVNLSSPAGVKLASGTVGNVYFQPGSDGSAFDIAAGAKVDRMSIGAANISVTGGGTLGDVTITASGANIAMTPKAYYIGDNLSAVINGVTRYGRTTSQTGSNVSRQSAAMYVTQNTAQTGGGVTISTATSQGGNRVDVSQNINARIPLSTRSGRLAYWIGFFIPNPGDGTSAVSVTYSFDGAPTTRNITQTIKDSRRGVEIAIPVTRYDDGAARGDLNADIFISWGSGQYETLWFRGGALELTSPTAAEEAALVGYFRNAAFNAYNGVTYNGSEAIRRLLASDNALGLNRRGFTALAESGMNNVAIKLSGERGLMTSRAAIQERLMIALAGEGVFFAINRATSAEQVKGIIEIKDFGYQIGIDDAEMSKYYTLSQVGRLSVARIVLLARGTDYKTEADLAKVFLDAVDTVRISEVTLLTGINAARTRDELQKLLEAKANNILLDIVTDGDPYKSFDANKKANIMANIFEKKPFISLDEVHGLFISLAGAPTIPPPAEDKVLGVLASDTTITIEVGGTATIDATVTTSSGTDTSGGAVSYTVDKAAVAIVDNTGTVRGAGKGTAKVTVASSKDPTKKTTVTINVVEPVTATGLDISHVRLEVAAGGQINVRALMTPSGSTSSLVWNSDDQNIATVSAAGPNATVKGVAPGVTRISARTEKEGLSASCTVIVVDTAKGIAVYPDNVTVGVGSSKTLAGVVSPITLSERGVTWKSEDTTKVRVDPNGVVTGVSDTGGAAVRVTATAKYDPLLIAECRVTVDPRIKGIGLSKTAMTLYRGGAESITASVIPAGSTDEIVWSYDSKYIKVEDIYISGVKQNGRAMITGVSAGTSRLIASLADDSSVVAECTVQVMSTTISVTMPSTLKLNVNDETYLAPKFTPATIENKAITWSCDPADGVVSVDPVTGRIKAEGKGVAKVTGVPDANQALTLECMVTVTEIAATAIRLDPTAVTLRISEQRKITAIVTPSNASNVNKILWNAPEDSVVQVSQEGYVTANGTTWKMVDIKDPVTGVKTGEVDTDFPVAITATIDGKTATCKVSVSRDQLAKIKSVEIGLDTWVFPVGFEQSLRLTFNGGKEDDLPADRKVKWTSDDPSIASVDASGYMICRSAGVTRINVISEDQAAQDSKVVVVGNVGLTSLDLSGLSNDYSKGRWVNLNMTGNRVATVTAKPRNSAATDQRFIWTSHDTSVVTVSPTGQLTAVAPGWAKIEIQPLQETCYGTVKPGDAIPEDGPNAEIQKYKGAGVYLDGGKYYGPNEIRNPGYDPNTPESPANPKTIRAELDQNKAIPLIVKNQIVDGSNEFWVFVSPLSGATANSLSFTGEPGKTVGINEEFTLTAQMGWGDSDNVTWDITGLTAVGAQPGRTTSGKAVITLKGAVSGTYTVKATAAVELLEGTNGAELQKGPLTATYTITVKDVPAESVAIKNAGANPIYINETRTLTAEVLPANATNKNVTWSSSDPLKIEINAVTGVATAKSPGAATITAATVDGGKTAAITLVAAERPAVESVRLSVAGETSVALYGSFDLVATVSPDGAIPASVIWTLSDPTIVDLAAKSSNLEKGVAGIKVGTTTITVNADGKTDACTVTVTAAAGGFRLEVRLPDGAQPDAAQPLTGVKLRTSAAVAVGKTLKLAPYVTPYNASKAGLKWESSNTAVATVSDGVVTGVKTGSARITVSDGGKIKAACTVTVKAKDDKPVTSITMNKKTLAINVGASSTLAVSIKPSNAAIKGVTWVASDETVARVEPTGKVIGVSGGSARITATSDSGGFTASCEVRVSVPVKSVTMSDKTVTLKAGETYKLGAAVNPDNATDKAEKWTSSAPSVASVSADGTVTAKKAGSATITVTVNGKKATCRVTVVK